MKKRGLSFKAVECRPGFSRELTGKKNQGPHRIGEQGLMSHFHQGDCTRAQTLRSGEYIHEKKKT
jgi:hypothetical protein